MPKDEDHSWIAEGAQVAQYNTRDDRAILTTIEKLTATQVVLANGRRYRQDNLWRQIGETNTWSPGELLPATHERVRRALARDHVSDLTHRLDGLVRVQSRTATPAELLATLDEAATLLAAAREAVAKLVGEED